MEGNLKFSQCPVCKGTNRIVENVVKSEIESGRLKPNSRIPVFITKSAMFDPNDKSKILARKQVVVLIGFYDVCEDCGTIYCMEMTKQLAFVEPNNNMPPLS